MLDFFDYVFYRITDSRYYQIVDPIDTWIWGWGVLSTCEYFNICSIIISSVLLFKLNININAILIICTALPIYLINLTRYNEKKYKKLKNRYTIEHGRKLKGMAVFFYITGSIIFFIMLCSLL